ncbi:MAG: gliding motility lipoprotein GldD [Cyclobacteriaceae bacterium]|nr:gliding motility lipoprotein GldD [Cyclobacteriaceae bacterium]
MACEESYLPKKKGYHKIDLPERSFQKLNADLPYNFEISSHAIVSADSSKGHHEKDWITINYPNFAASIQISYYPLKGNMEKLKELSNDAYRLTSRHNVKAYSIQEQLLTVPNGMVATLAELDGEVPSQFQFHISDSVDHFLRGALYFPSSRHNDSLAPIIEYVKIDIVHLLNTLEFEN